LRIAVCLIGLVMAFVAAAAREDDTEIPLASTPDFASPRATTPAPRTASRPPTLPIEVVFTTGGRCPTGSVVLQPSSDEVRATATPNTWEEQFEGLIVNKSRVPVLITVFHFKWDDPTGGIAGQFDALSQMKGPIGPEEKRAFTARALVAGDFSGPPLVGIRLNAAWADTSLAEDCPMLGTRAMSATPDGATTTEATTPVPASSTSTTSTSTTSTSTTTTTILQPEASVTEITIEPRTIYRELCDDPAPQVTVRVDFPDQVTAMQVIVDLGGRNNYSYGHEVTPGEWVASMRMNGVVAGEFAATVMISGSVTKTIWDAGTVTYIYNCSATE
jgi:hypothetical protein